MNYEKYSRCACGAITVTVDGQDYSCLAYRRKKFFPGLDLRKVPRFETSYSCNHCANRFGLDLCGCGSGNEFGYCDGGFDAWEVPMQKLGEYTCVTDGDSWVADLHKQSKVI